MIEKVKYKKKLYAIIIRKKFKKKSGINFFTEKEHTQQIGYMSHPSGHIIKPHIHKKKITKNLMTTEVILVLKGKIRVDFYSKKNKKDYLSSKVINKDDILMLINGAHGFKIIKSAKIIEIKQGPYDEVNDKLKFDETSENKIRYR
ncbi:hypothetical protein N9S67_02025 [Candidatus Pelagibacter sp.]|nr:hypothetical protein [Candidatus Pelagibacter sp.]